MKRTLALLAIIFLSASATALGAEVIKNWPAPPTWMGPSSSSSNAGRAPLAVTAAPLPFIPVTPCRVADTRGNGFTGAYGPPSIGGGAARTFVIPGKCGIPASAVAVSFNFAVWNTTSYGDFNIFPAGAAVSTVSTLNWGPGVLALANAAVIPLGTAGGITVLNESSSTVDLFFDVNGYYASTNTSTAGTLYNITPASYGIWGETTYSSGSAWGVIGEANGGSNGIGVYGRGTWYGVVGSVLGAATGVSGSSSSGIGVDGNSTSGPGVTGTSASSYGVHGNSTSSNGVWAESTNLDGLWATGGRHGIYSVSTTGGAAGALWGVFGLSNSTSPGAAGTVGQGGGQPTNFAQNLGGPAGVLGMTTSNYGVAGVSNPAGYAGKFISQDGTTGDAKTMAYLGYSSMTAGQFYGNVSIFAGLNGSAGVGNLSVAGTLSKGAGSFKIDHPLDPENKYLYHSFVESPDMKNVYDGVVELDAVGSAVVPLPAYFEALNRDFRYQLTSIGSRQPGLFIDVEVANNQFVISGGKAYGKVSWQVTGIRKDPFAVKYPIVAEVEKEAEARGHYLHPDVYGKPGERSAAVLAQEAAKQREREKILGAAAGQLKD